MAVFDGAGAGVGAGFGAGVVAIGALCGSTLGEQAANSARPAKGVISIKRRRVGVFIWEFLVRRGLSSGCQSAMARQRTDAFTLSDPRRHIACDSGCVSVRWFTQLTQATDDSEGSHPAFCGRRKTSASAEADVPVHTVDRRTSFNKDQMDRHHVKWGYGT